MVLEVDLNPESVKKLEKFLTTNKYKELAENAMSFNRKLNEERKMRIPYVDGQVPVTPGKFLSSQNSVLVNIISVAEPETQGAETFGWS
jgi:hypothetical protein